VAAMLIAILWVWKQSTAYPMIKTLRGEIEELKAYITTTTPTSNQRSNLMRRSEEKKRV